MESEFINHCLGNNLEGVNDCLSRGVDVNTKEESSGRHWTALMVACRAGNSAIVSRLVQVPGLDINYQDRDGFTAAILASNKGHTECVRRLAETDRVDWNKRNRSGQTPLYWALISVRSTQTDIVNIIVGQPNIDYTVKNKGGYTLAHAAVTGGNLKCIKTLASAKVLI